jgi:SAM-dependent methyltransferase
MTKMPVAILAFNRPDYLERTLRSLAEQVQDTLAGREIHLFQDGGRNAISGNEYASKELIDKNIEIFRALFPTGVVHAQKENLGIARHFDFVERYFFEECNFDSAIFLEDDMILSPVYLSVLERLMARAMTNERIGYVAAYGNHRAPVADQTKNLSKLIEMDHKWGFALSRRQWLRQRPLVDQYLELVRDMDYQRRNSVKIIDWMLSIGALPAGTSQDAVKDVAMWKAGATKLKTFACYGKYIGKVGVHYRESQYEQLGYENTEFCPEAATGFEWPSDAQIDQLIAARLESLRQNTANVSKIFPFYDQAGAEIAPKAESYADKFVYLGKLLPTDAQFKSGKFFEYALDFAKPPTKLPFDDDSVIGFQSQDVLEHVVYDKVAIILDEIFRSLRPGGLFRLSVPDYNSPLLKARSLYDSDGNILYDAAMGGVVKASAAGGLDVRLEPGGGVHVWFPTYTKILRLILSSEIRKCAEISIHHAWIDAKKFICADYDRSVMPVLRAPPGDMRAGGAPISIVVDFVK